VDDFVLRVRNLRDERTGSYSYDSLKDIAPALYVYHEAKDAFQHSRGDLEVYMATLAMLNDASMHVAEALQGVDILLNDRLSVTESVADDGSRLIKFAPNERYMDYTFQVSWIGPNELRVLDGEVPSVGSRVSYYVKGIRTDLHVVDATDETFRVQEMVLRFQGYKIFDTSLELFDYFYVYLLYALVVLQAGHRAYGFAEADSAWRFALMVEFPHRPRLVRRFLMRGDAEMTLDAYPGLYFGANYIVSVDKKWGIGRASAGDYVADLMQDFTTTNQFVFVHHRNIIKHADIGSEEICMYLFFPSFGVQSNTGIIDFDKSLVLDELVNCPYKDIFSETASLPNTLADDTIDDLPRVAYYVYNQTGNLTHCPTLEPIVRRFTAVVESGSDRLLFPSDKIEVQRGRSVQHQFFSPDTRIVDEEIFTFNHVFQSQKNSRELFCAKGSDFLQLSGITSDTTGLHLASWFWDDTNEDDQIAGFVTSVVVQTNGVLKFEFDRDLPVNFNNPMLNITAYYILDKPVLQTRSPREMIEVHFDERLCFTPVYAQKAYAMRQFIRMMACLQTFDLRYTSLFDKITPSDPDVQSILTENDDYFKLLTYFQKYYTDYTNDDYRFIPSFVHCSEREFQLKWWFQQLYARMVDLYRFISHEDHSMVNYFFSEYDVNADIDLRSLKGRLLSASLREMDVVYMRLRLPAYTDQTYQATCLPNEMGYRFNRDADITTVTRFAEVSQRIHRIERMPNRDQHVYFLHPIRNSHNLPGTEYSLTVKNPNSLAFYLNWGFCYSYFAVALRDELSDMTQTFDLTVDLNTARRYIYGYTPEETMLTNAIKYVDVRKSFHATVSADGTFTTDNADVPQVNDHIKEIWGVEIETYLVISRSGDTFRVKEPGPQGAIASPLEFKVIPRCEDLTTAEFREVLRRDLKESGLLDQDDEEKSVDVATIRRPLGRSFFKPLQRGPRPSDARFSDKWKVGVVLRRQGDGRILVHQRYDGMIACPGGVVDEPFSGSDDAAWQTVLLNTARKEVHEETGLRLRHFIKVAFYPSINLTMYTNDVDLERMPTVIPGPLPTDAHELDDTFPYNSGVLRNDPLVFAGANSRSAWVTLPQLEALAQLHVINKEGQETRAVLARNLEAVRELARRGLIPHRLDVAQLESERCSGVAARDGSSLRIPTAYTRPSGPSLDLLAVEHCQLDVSKRLVTTPASSTRSERLLLQTSRLTILERGRRIVLDVDDFRILVGSTDSEHRVSFEYTTESGETRGYVLPKDSDEPDEDTLEAWDMHFVPACLELLSYVSYIPLLLLRNDAPSGQPLTLSHLPSFLEALTSSKALLGIQGSDANNVNLSYNRITIWNMVKSPEYESLAEYAHAVSNTLVYRMLIYSYKHHSQDGMSAHKCYTTTIYSERVDAECINAFSTYLRQFVPRSRALQRLLSRLNATSLVEFPVELVELMKMLFQGVFLALHGLHRYLHPYTLEILHDMGLPAASDALREEGERRLERLQHQSSVWNNPLLTWRGDKWETTSYPNVGLHVGDVVTGLSLRGFSVAMDINVSKHYAGARFNEHQQHYSRRNRTRMLKWCMKFVLPTELPLLYLSPDSASFATRRPHLFHDDVSDFHKVKYYDSVHILSTSIDVSVGSDIMHRSTPWQRKVRNLFFDDGLDEIMVPPNMHFTLVSASSVKPDLIHIDVMVPHSIALRYVPNEARAPVLMDILRRGDWSYVASAHERTLFEPSGARNYMALHSKSQTRRDVKPLLMSRQQRSSLPVVSRYPRVAFQAFAMHEGEVMEVVDEYSVALEEKMPVDVVQYIEPMPKADLDDLSALTSDARLNPLGGRVRLRVDRSELRPRTLPDWFVQHLMEKDEVERSIAMAVLRDAMPEAGDADRLMVLLEPFWRRACLAVQGDSSLGSGAYKTAVAVKMCGETTAIVGGVRRGRDEISTSEWDVRDDQPRQRQREDDVLQNPDLVLTLEQGNRSREVHELDPISVIAAKQLHELNLACRLACAINGLDQHVSVNAPLTYALLDLNHAPPAPRDSPELQDQLIRAIENQRSLRPVDASYLVLALWARLPSTLSAFLAKHKTIGPSVDAAERLAVCMVKTFGYLHGMGVYHLDAHPENWFVVLQGGVRLDRVVLHDFGWSFDATDGGAPDPTDAAFNYTFPAVSPYGSVNGLQLMMLTDGYEMFRAVRKLLPPDRADTWFSDHLQRFDELYRAAGASTNLWSEMYYKGIGSEDDPIRRVAASKKVLRALVEYTQLAPPSSLLEPGSCQTTDQAAIEKIRQTTVHDGVPSVSAPPNGSAIERYLQENREYAPNGPHDYLRDMFVVQNVRTGTKYMLSEATPVTFPLDAARSANLPLVPYSYVADDVVILPFVICTFDDLEPDVQASYRGARDNLLRSLRVGRDSGLRVALVVDPTVFEDSDIQGDATVMRVRLMAFAHEWLTKPGLESLVRSAAPSSIAINATTFSTSGSNIQDPNAYEEIF